MNDDLKFVGALIVLLFVGVSAPFVYLFCFTSYKTDLALCEKAGGNRLVIKEVYPATFICDKEEHTVVKIDAGF
jgi:hypothetical protein